MKGQKGHIDWEYVEDQVLRHINEIGKALVSEWRNTRALRGEEADMTETVAACIRTHVTMVMASGHKLFDEHLRASDPEDLKELMIKFGLEHCPEAVPEEWK